MKKQNIFFLLFLATLFYSRCLAQIDLPLWRILQANIREGTRITPESFQNSRENLRNFRIENRLQIRNEIRAEREKRQQEMLEWRERLRERLRVFRDEQKRAIVERVCERINALNQIITDHYLQVLDHLEDVLLRIESRATKAKINGLDISEVEKAIVDAQGEIDKAREMVKQQASKVYSLATTSTTTSEETIKTEVRNLRQQIHADLKGVEFFVRKAREKVREAAIALAQIPRVDSLEISPTSTTESSTSSQ